MNRRSILAALLLLPVLTMAAQHRQCGELEPGKGMRQELVLGKDRMCGWLEVPFDATYQLAGNVPGTVIWLAKQKVIGPLSLKKGAMPFIVIEAPASEDFVLTWDTGIGVQVEVPVFLLRPPTLTVTGRCPEYA